MTTMFIEDLLPPLRPIVLQAREDRPRSTFADIAARAHLRGDAFKAPQHPRPPQKKLMNFLNKRPACDTVAFSDVGDQSFGGEAPHVADGPILAGESPAILDFVTRPLEQTQ